MFYILSGFFPLQLLHSLSLSRLSQRFPFRIRHLCLRVFYYSSIAFHTSPESPSASSLLRGLYMQLRFSDVEGHCGFLTPFILKNISILDPRPHILRNVTVDSLEMPLHASVKNFFLPYEVLFFFCLFVLN